jgi:type IV pilus assembly protein PilO
MDLSEINWDFNAAGSWPLQIKVFIILLVCCLVAGGGVYTFTMDQLAELETLEAEEVTLIQTFENKQRKAVNLADYRDQFEQIKKLLSSMMKQMPTKAEVANLLSEISQTAVNSGLEQKLFQPEPEEQKDFYVELPYSIEMVGTYEELGLFIGGIAALPRIVTVHDIKIATLEGQVVTDKTSDKDGIPLRMTTVIKTYNEAAGNDESESTNNKPAEAPKQ